MKYLTGSFDWLVKHEKFVILVTLILIFSLAFQLRFCGPEPETIELKTPQQTVANATPSASGHLTGTWEMTVKKKKGGVQNWILKLTQDGDTLSGVLTSEGGDLDVNGKIKGDDVSLVAKKFGVTLDIPAKVEGEIMTGTMTALTVTLHWTAKRQ